MKEGDKWKATFYTNHGLFKPLVMFFGLTNSPTTFQTMMDSIFKGLISKGKVIVYLGNILVFTESLEEHWKVVKKVVYLLHIHNFFLKPEKCKFEHTEIEYLRVIISHNSVCMDPVKVARVAKWPVSSKRKEVQLFLGLTNFYQWFIQDFSHHAQPLFNLTKKDML
jgi:Reverse transcriptase (RNA-dependent DNA polymerase)